MTFHEGTITENDFKQLCKEMVNRPYAQRNQWKWHDNGHCQIEQIVKVSPRLLQDSLEAATTANDDSNPLIDEQEYNSDDIEDITDDNLTSNITSADQIPICFKYSIAYSVSFQVPVLYFNAFNMSDGKLVGTDQILGIVRGMNSDNGLIPSHFNPYTMITQGEHPVLNTIFHYIHPCETSSTMSLLMNSSSSSTSSHYVISWLSLMGRVVLLDIPIDILSNNSECNFSASP